MHTLAILSAETEYNSALAWIPFARLKCLKDVLRYPAF
jgi:hypothetical protein